MPRIVSQEDKTEGSINAQPKTYNHTVRMIQMLDIAGYKPGEIAEAVKISNSRVSTIMHSPLYSVGKQTCEKELRESVIDKTSDRIVSGDPVTNLIKSKALTAIGVQIELMENGKSEAIRLDASEKIASKAGYKSSSEKTSVTIEVTDKMASRFERLLSDEPRGNARISAINIEKEVS